MSSSKQGLKLQSGANMPLLGLGTLMRSLQAKDQEIIEAVLKALELGYRHIDTAALYRNEAAIGRALRIAFDKGLVKREDVFVTTKLPPNGHESDKVEHFLRRSLKELQLSYVDLYLVHTPIAFQYKNDEEFFSRDSDGKAALDTNSDLVATWKAMEAQVDAGRAKDIGVSNFNSQQVKLICDNARIKPSNNQIECHVYFQQEKLYRFCKELGVTITAYAPFGSPAIVEWRKKQYNQDVPENPSVLENQILVEIGKKYDKNSAQVALRWLIQRGIIVIPKSSNETRIQQNIEIFDFELSREDMDQIRSIDAGKRFFNSDMVPGMTEHPQYPYHIEF